MEELFGELFSWEISFQIHARMFSELISQSFPAERISAKLSVDAMGGWKKEGGGKPHE